MRLNGYKDNHNCLYYKVHNLLPSWFLVSDIALPKNTHLKLTCCQESSLSPFSRNNIIDESRSNMRQLS